MSTKRRVNSDGSLGATFWLGLIGALLLAGVGIMIAFFIFGSIWSNWGFFAALVVFLALACGIAYVMDRRDRRADSGY